MVTWDRGKKKVAQTIIIILLMLLLFISSLLKQIGFDTILIPIFPLENNQDENLSNIIDK